mmetsp:Transcript_64982/g.170832  ORF Transcript_64982/g.170832 Transcript_64982/m.170832 type:complete len:242 (-) Transcript_64982:431-1156(-)
MGFQFCCQLDVAQCSSDGQLRGGRNCRLGNGHLPGCLLSDYVHGCAEAGHHGGWSRQIPVGPARVREVGDGQHRRCHHALDVGIPAVCHLQQRRWPRPPEASAAGADRHRIGFLADTGGHGGHAGDSRRSQHAAGHCGHRERLAGDLHQRLGERIPGEDASHLRHHWRLHGGRHRADVVRGMDLRAGHGSRNGHAAARERRVRRLVGARGAECAGAASVLRCVHGGLCRGLHFHFGHGQCC